MRLAIDAVKDGRAAAAVSAGNTGALMAMAKVVLKTLPGIDRPAICGIFPTRAKPVVVLDLGANIDCDAEHLVQFAVMGEVFARLIFGVAKPGVGLLNVGTEELKGDAVVRVAAAMLRDSDLHIDFRGFVEGNDVIDGRVDVVVDRRLHRQCRPQDRRGHGPDADRGAGPVVQQQLARQARLSDRQAGPAHAARPLRPPPAQRRHVPRRSTASS